MERKIAVVTQDEQTISSHFGMAPYYQVFSIADGHVVAQEQREKPHHQGHHNQPQAQVQMEHEHQQHDGPQGRGHGAMFAPIADCQVLLCGGMGRPAYQGALEAGLEVVLVGGKILAALQAYLDGQVASDPRRVH